MSCPISVTELVTCGNVHLKKEIWVLSSGISPEFDLDGLARHVTEGEINGDGALLGDRE